MPVSWSSRILPRRWNGCSPLPAAECAASNAATRFDSCEAAGLSTLNSAIRRFVLSGGKRVRPQLCLWAYDAVRGGAAPPLELLDLACVWELFHAFLLAHDDIIDASDTRRNEPSLHRQLASLDGECLRFGTNLAIVAGDLLYCALMRLLHEVDLPDPTYRSVLRLFSRVACTTGFGQAVDICQSHAPLEEMTEATVLRGYHWKTAAYTFEGPMLCGAVAAGLGEAACRPLSTFALCWARRISFKTTCSTCMPPPTKGAT